MASNANVFVSTGRRPMNPLLPVINPDDPGEGFDLSESTRCAFTCRSGLPG